MKVKLIPLLAGLITFSAVTTPLIVKAQDEAPAQPTPTQTAPQRHHGKKPQLNLTDDQKQQLEQIEKDTRDQIQSVLTPDQQAQLQTLMQNRQGQRHQERSRQGRQDFLSQLNLTDEQKAKIKDIMQQQKARRDAVFTPEQQQQMQQMRQQWQQHQQQGDQ